MAPRTVAELAPVDPLEHPLERQLAALSPTQTYIRHGRARVNIASVQSDWERLGLPVQGPVTGPDSIDERISMFCTMTRHQPTGVIIFNNIINHCITLKSSYIALHRHIKAGRFDVFYLGTLVRCVVGVRNSNNERVVCTDDRYRLDGISDELWALILRITNH